MDSRIAAFLAKAYQVRDSREQVRALCRTEFQAIERDYATDASRKTRLTKYRNALREADLTKYFLTALRLPKARARALRASYDAQVQTIGEHQQPIHHYPRLIARAEECLASRSYSAVMLGLALLSGRRTYELCVSGDFSLDDFLPVPKVWFTGQAKTRDADRAKERYAIPLLTDRDAFAHAWLRFRDMKDFSSYADSRKFTQFAGMFGESYQRYFASLMPPDTSVKHLRDTYALIAYHTRPHADIGVAINYFIKGILGHEDDKASTAQSYQKFYLAD